jgi:hypothetical protein
MTTLDEARVRRYLLGRLSEDEASALEAEYFASGEALEQVWGVENDLVDAYVAGELRPEERAAFESHYLASALHRDRVASARALRAAMHDPPAAALPQRSATGWWPWLALAAGLVLALTAWRLRSTPPAPPHVVAQATPVPTPVVRPVEPSPDAPPTPGSRPPVVAAFALSSVLLRGAQDTPRLRVPADTDELRLTLEAGALASASGGDGLPFVVATVEGDRVATGFTRAGPDGPVVRILAARVPPGDYILSLHAAGAGAGDSPLQQYFFRVARP